MIIKNSGLVLKAGSWVVVDWEDVVREIGYVINPKPEKGAQYAEIFFMRKKSSRIEEVNHAQILEVLPTKEVRNSGYKLPTAMGLQAFAFGDKAFAFGERKWK